ncbi:MAG: hypothetical protein HYW01_00175 [Deltaproteobacteria bacterium]|nr:hypothetical protein [Deltaproteobacteria bacterium]
MNIRLLDHTVTERHRFIQSFDCLVEIIIGKVRNAYMRSLQTHRQACPESYKLNVLVSLDQYPMRGDFLTHASLVSCSIMNPAHRLGGDHTHPGARFSG